MALTNKDVAYSKIVRERAHASAIRQHEYILTEKHLSMEELKEKYRQRGREVPECLVSITRDDLRIQNLHRLYPSECITMLEESLIRGLVVDYSKIAEKHNY
jgi:hypothetical protein